MRKFPAHKLESLREGRVPLHRATGTDNTTVLIAGYGAQAASSAVLACLQGIYAFRRELEPDWAVMPLELSLYDDELVLVLDDPGGQPLSRWCGRPLEIGTFLPLAIGMATAICDMHAHSIVHRDLNPDNILIDKPSDRWVARLAGFGFASRGQPPTGEAERVGGSFAYMAPELGGRMNIPVDARADLYSLGCIFYLLLTGVLPFNAGDAVSWVHAHATRRPLAPAACVPGMPEQISLIVMKMLEKAPDERYQSAKSLLADLDRCLGMWQRQAGIGIFPLDAGNVLARLVQVGRIFGREHELGALFEGFDRIAAGGSSELIVVSGYSGVGKSALVCEAVRRLQMRAELRFAAGKNKEGSSAVPYSSLSQMLESLVRPILGYSEVDFLDWRRRIAAAVGSYGASLQQVVPDLNAILGHSAPVQELSPHIERERFLQASARLIGAFAASGRPLVLFFDDLQWADAGTLAVIERLLADMRDLPLLVIGAFRDSEVDGDYSVRLGFQAAASRVSHVPVKPLELSSRRQLLCNALQCSPDHVLQLADLIEQKTDGNPFFAKQFIMALVRDGLLTLDSDSISWVWDLEQIRARRYTDNVVDLLLRQLDLLPMDTQTLLRRLSCLGDRASISLLCAASGVAENAIRSGLQAAVEANCIYQDGDAYVFWHDRIRQAVYASIPDAERPAMHLDIGRLLARDHDGIHDGGEGLFDMVGQLNKGKERAASREERLRFALLNLQAGRRAKATMAYASALTYFSAAADFLEDQADGEPARMAQFFCGECEFMTGALAEAETRLAALTTRADDLIFGANLARLRVALYTMLSRPDLALEAGFDFLRKCGVAISLKPTNEEVDREFQRLDRLIAGRDTERLFALPIMDDPVWRSAMEVCADLLPSALFTDANLIDLILTRMSIISLEYGHCDASCHSYASMNLVFGSRYADYPAGHAFGELAVRLVDERGLSRYKSRVYMAFGTVVLPWTKPLHLSHRFIREAFQAALESGDHPFALYCGRNLVSNLIVDGAPLGDVRAEGEHSLGHARAANCQFAVDSLLSQLTLIRRLQGRLAETGENHGNMRWPQEGMPQTLVEFSYWVYEMQACFVFGDSAGARQAERRAAPSLSSARSFIEVADFHYYGALARVAACGDPLQKDNLWEGLQTHLANLSVWARSCPENFAGRLTLVLAEVARLDGRILDAEKHYKEALDHAREYDFPQNDGIASELAAAFYGARGYDIIRRAYLRHARKAYLRWGAQGKVDHLDACHPFLRETAENPNPIDRLRQLDVEAVVRVSNALASDIILPRLVATVMRTALENASAEKGVLAIARNGVWQIQAQASIGPDAIAVTQQTLEMSSDVLPLALVQTVMHRRECILLDDARAAGAFTQDAYVQRYQPRSVLCVPLIKQSVLVGFLYLENNLAAGAFTSDKAAVLEVLASQAAIALENAHLYEDLYDQNQQRARAEEALRGIQAELARAGRVTAMGELVASIVHEVSQPISAIGTSAAAALRWLDRSKPDIEEVRLMLHHIVGSSTRVKGTIQGLRAMMKKSEPQFSMFDINEAIREVVILLRGQLDGHQVELELIGVGEQRLVEGDRVQIQQVILNLLMNGAESMADVTTRPRTMVVASSLGQDGMVRITVEDAGSGIDGIARARIFEPLFTTKENGMGMGLPICRSIVEAHGGTLRVRPGQAAGTVFDFTITPAPPRSGSDCP
jgi:predicted ATPase/signal transduction histidine kinase